MEFINPDSIKIEQELRFKEKINNIQLNYIIDLFLSNAIVNDNEVLYESNLHSIDAYNFINSYINQFKAISICYFYYVDDIDILIERVRQRVGHLGHDVPVETIRERYINSFDLILKNLNNFDEVHFYDTSKIEVSEKIIEIINGEANYINEKINFKWSDKIVEKII